MGQGCGVTVWQTEKSDSEDLYLNRFRRRLVSSCRRSGLTRAYLDLSAGARKGRGRLKVLSFPVSVLGRLNWVRRVFLNPEPELPEYRGLGRGCAGRERSLPFTGSRFLISSSCFSSATISSRKPFRSEYMAGVTSSGPAGRLIHVALNRSNISRATGFHGKRSISLERLSFVISNTFVARA